MAIFIVNFIPDTFSSVILCAKKKTGWKWCCFPRQERLFLPSSRPCRLTISALWLNLTGAVQPAGMVKGRGRGRYHEESTTRDGQGRWRR
ncbi:Os12g0595700 [Oryza sativa Japonica Group]|uniref:Os12g0595700 protein n=1 Tax=Oryza sativa subsp. japonica TaxID=39947 RepID=A0A0P0YC60_ORYSJ|nr:Os12g0595700 [Oryza sativa Japonica Group]